MQNEKDCFFKRYDDQIHGWTVRGDKSNDVVRMAMEDAFEHTKDFMLRVMV